MIVEFIDEARGEFGVAPICDALQVAPSTYYSAKTRPPLDRAIRDAVMMPVLWALWKANYSVYGARKLWIAARNAGHEIGRDQVARLMRELGIWGVKRSRRVRTTRRDDTAVRSPDLVNREFVAEAPNQLWVTDLTYVATWSGVAYVCFIVDAFSRRIVGWRRRLAHAHRHGPRRARDGEMVTRHEPSGPDLPLRCRQPKRIQSVVATPAC